MRPLALCLLLAGPAPAAAATQPASTPQVVVTVGQALRVKAGDYGQDEIDRLTRVLAEDVGRALDRSGRGASALRLQLVLEDATPNRPTASEVGRASALSASSSGLGGAWIDGVATLAGGRKIPIGYSAYDSDMHGEFSTATWGGAERAFEAFAARIAKGELPDRAAPGAATPTSAASWPGSGASR